MLQERDKLFKFEGFRSVPCVNGLVNQKNMYENNYSSLNYLKKMSADGKAYVYPLRLTHYNLFCGNQISMVEVKCIIIIANYLAEFYQHTRNINPSSNKCGVDLEYLFNCEKN